MKKNKEKIPTSVKVVLIVLVAISAITILWAAISPLIEENVSTNNVESTPTNYDVLAINQAETDIEYLKTTANLMGIFSDQAFIDADIIIATAKYEITYAECSELFSQSKSNYNTLGKLLNEINVPNKYKTVHQYYINSVIYIEQGAEYLADDCGNIELANIKYELATSELLKGNRLFETLL